jgi:hypothetical protein
MAADEAGPGGMVTCLHRWRPRAPRLYSIAEVGAACGLPGPVIMQLVPRTWTDAGWMYTAEQLDESVTVAADIRRRRSGVPGGGPPG